MDKYADYRLLAAARTEGKDFRVRVRSINGCPTVVVAPHGGGIEPGTSEIAEAIAGDDLTFYTFDGVMAKGNGRLHITSTRFDEPRCLEAVQAGSRVLTIHGEASKKPVVFVGGRDMEWRRRLTAAVAKRGFTVEAHSDPALQGEDPANLCNRGRSGAGVQLELSDGLRRTFFQSLRASGRQVRTPKFAEFVAAVRDGLPEGLSGRGHR